MVTCFKAKKIARRDIFDIFWGTELYPRFGHALWDIGWDVKLFTNCRFGMMYWGLSGCVQGCVHVQCRQEVTSVSGVTWHTQVARPRVMALYMQ